MHLFCTLQFMKLKMKLCSTLTPSNKLPTFSPHNCYKEFEYSVRFIGRETILLPSLHFPHYPKCQFWKQRWLMFIDPWMDWLHSSTGNTLLHLTETSNELVNYDSLPDFVFKRKEILFLSASQKIKVRSIHIFNARFYGKSMQ